MPIIKCPECGKDISDKAEACPNCGNPMRPVVIEKTSKSWKSAKLISTVVFIAGIIISFYGYSKYGWWNGITGVGLSWTIIGFIALMIAKFGAWWHHK